jgi:hypothetical protein
MRIRSAAHDAADTRVRATLALDLAFDDDDEERIDGAVLAAEAEFGLFQLIDLKAGRYRVTLGYVLLLGSLIVQN